MEIRVDLDEALVEELAEEAELQGFDDREAYLRWIVAHRPMSELASTQAPAVASRVSELEERVKLLERQLDLDDPVDPDADLGAGSSGASGDLGGDTGGGGGASLGEMDGSVEPVDLEDPGPEPDEDEAEDDEEAEAQDDDIAEAIGDLSLEDEETRDEGGN